MCDFLKDFVYYKGFYHPKHTTIDSDQCSLSTETEQLYLVNPTDLNEIPVPDSTTSDSDSIESSSLKSVNSIDYVNDDITTNIENRVILKAKRKLNQSQVVVKSPDVKVTVDELTEQLELLDALSQVDPDTLIYCNCGYSASKRNYWYIHHGNSTSCIFVHSLLVCLLQRPGVVFYNAYKLFSSSIMFSFVFH